MAFPFNPELNQTPILRRLVPSVLKRWARLTWTGGFRVVRVRGCLFLVSYRDYVDRQLAFYGDYEGAQIDYFGAEIAGFKPRHFLDIGANAGLYSILARRNWGLPVTAFEPDLRNLSHLHANLFLNRLSDDIDVEACAASDHDGSARFLAFPDTSSGQSRIAESDHGTQEVRTVKLDSVLGFRGERLAVKIDVEGHELAVLAGMERTLVENDCLLQIESFPDRAEAVYGFLAARGYLCIQRIAHDHYFRTSG